MKKTRKTRNTRDTVDRQIVGMDKDQRLALIRNVVFSDNVKQTKTKRSGIKRSRAIAMFKTAFLKVAAE